MRCERCVVRPWWQFIYLQIVLHTRRRWQAFISFLCISSVSHRSLRYCCCYFRLFFHSFLHLLLFSLFANSIHLSFVVLYTRTHTYTYTDLWPSPLSVALELVYRREMNYTRCTRACFWSGLSRRCSVVLRFRVYSIYHKFHFNFTLALLSVYSCVSNDDVCEMRDADDDDVPDTTAAPISSAHTHSYVYVLDRYYILWSFGFITSSCIVCKYAQYWFIIKI